MTSPFLQKLQTEEPQLDMPPPTALSSRQLKYLSIGMTKQAINISSKSIKCLTVDRQQEREYFLNLQPIIASELPTSKPFFFSNKR